MQLCARSSSLISINGRLKGWCLENMSERTIKAIQIILSETFGLLSAIDRH